MHLEKRLERCSTFKKFLIADPRRRDNTIGNPRVLLRRKIASELRATDL